MRPPVHPRLSSTVGRTENVAKQSLALSRDHSRLPPKWFARLGEQCLRAINAFLDAVIPPPMRVFDLAFTGYAQAEVIRTLCALGVAEALAGGPKTAEELASELGEANGSCAHHGMGVSVHGFSVSHPAQPHLLAPLMGVKASVTLRLVSLEACDAFCCQHMPSQGRTWCA